MGDKCLKALDLKKAREYFLAAGDYENAAESLIYCDYYEGHRLFTSGKYEEAQEFLSKEEVRALDLYLPHFKDFHEAESYLREQTDALSNYIGYT